MEFVKPETVRITLNGAGTWIDVKKELTIAEDEWFTTAGYRRREGELVVDWVMMKLARVLVYVTDWSDKTPVSESAIRNLTPDSFDEIDRAARAHIAAVAEEKKARTPPGGVTSERSP